MPNGVFALLSNTTGTYNTADGVEALYSNTTGNSNIALGLGAGKKLTTGDNNIDIGNDGVAAEANTIRIGKQKTHLATFIAGISGTTASGGMPVYVNTSGQLAHSLPRNVSRIISSQWTRRAKRFSRSNR